jgi:hypothetical protein
MWGPLCNDYNRGVANPTRVAESMGEAPIMSWLHRLLAI